MLSCHSYSNGGNVKSFKQPLLTILVIFATAYFLTIVGCSPSSSTNNQQPAVTPSTPSTPTTPELSAGDSNATEAVLKPIDPKDMRLCTNDEFSNLINWKNALNLSDDSIKEVSARKNDKTIKLALDAIKKCDQAEFYHSLKPCKKIRKVITTPDKPEVKAYDAYRINQQCKFTENYLIGLKMRPDPKLAYPSEPAEPAPIQPSPVPPANPPLAGGQYRQCTSAEFAQLNTWRSNLDSANKNIAKLGSISNWKYDTIAIDSASTATKSCETLIKYHTSQPCQREKTYTANSLKEQCKTARTYYYNFAQRSESLIVPTAQLYLNTEPLSQKIFSPGASANTYGQCVITNQSNLDIQYSGQKTLVTEARVYTDQLQMFVLVTQEGLKLECYGMDFTSAATSLREVIKLLAAKNSSLEMQYELN